VLLEEDLLLSEPLEEFDLDESFSTSDFFADSAAAAFLTLGDFTIEDFGVCLLFLEVLRPLAGMARECGKHKQTGKNSTKTRRSRCQKKRRELERRG
jgi:hypothetical protein